jgi:hypothetical protein
MYVCLRRDYLDSGYLLVLGSNSGRRLVVGMSNIPLIEGKRPLQRRRAGMAWMHSEFGGKCARCLKPSDLVEHAKVDPHFKRWTKSHTRLDLHHPHRGKSGRPIFRLGNMYVPASSRPAKQARALADAFEKLEGCILMCQGCHLLHHHQHGGHVWTRGE